LRDRPPHLRGRDPRPPLGGPEEASLRRYISYYLCLVTLIDEYVGKLVDALADHELLDNTVILYTSDHGEMLGDFAKFGKGNFYDPVLKVPLLARPPAGCAPRHFSGLMEVMDIAPTVLDYAGIPSPREMQATSFRPVLEGGEGGHAAVLSEYTTNDQAINGKCLVTERYKYVLWDTQEGGEFYDLQEDPRELRNVYYEPAYREQRDRHAELLACRLMRSEVGYTASRTERY